MRVSFAPIVTILALAVAASGGCVNLPPQAEIRINPEPAGPNCQYGGVKIETGHDDNENGVLDDGEVEDTEYACNQRVDGATSLVDIDLEAPGANCDTGGIKVTAGLDDDDDGVLDPSEVDQTQYVCNGLSRLLNIVPLAPGSDCEQGGVRVEAGFDQDGNGSLSSDEVDVTATVCSGRSSLVKVTEVEPGTGCPDGGIKIQNGFDVNGNGSLDTAEVQGTEYVCHGADGYTGLVVVSNVAPSPGGCLFGGTKVESGLDVDRDNVLDPGEVDASQTVCAVQVNNHLTLVKNSVILPGATCDYGGVKTEVGIDDDDDGVLDVPGEVDNTYNACNQVLIVDGLNSLVSTTPASGAQCPFGGYVFKSGLDSDRDGTLDAGEVTETEVTCNGANGYNGVVRTTAYSGPSCGPNGGITLQSGLDMDRDGTLDVPAEVQSTTTVCHGDDGATGASGHDSLIDTSDALSACGIYGGIAVDSGTDDDDDGYLDWNEVDNTAYVCNGYDGYTSLIEIFDDGGACGAYGGSRIEVGLDEDGDLVLDASEVTSYTYVCNGYDGYNALIETTVGSYYECGYETGMRLDMGLDLDGDGWLDSGEITSHFFICENWETYYP